MKTTFHRHFTNELNTILPNIFAEIMIEKEYKMRKTKTSCILNENLATNFLQKAAKFM